MRRRPNHNLVLFFPGRLDALGQSRQSDSSTHTDDDHYKAARAHDHDHEHDHDHYEVAHNHDHYEVAHNHNHNHNHAHDHNHHHAHDHNHDRAHDHDHHPILSLAQLSMVPTLTSEVVRPTRNIRAYRTAPGRQFQNRRSGNARSK